MTLDLFCYTRMMLLCLVILSLPVHHIAAQSFLAPPFIETHIDNNGWSFDDKDNRIIERGGRIFRTAIELSMYLGSIDEPLHENDIRDLNYLAFEARKTKLAGHYRTGGVRITNKETLENATVKVFPSPRDAHEISRNVQELIQWINGNIKDPVFGSFNELDPVTRAAYAHYWLVMRLHPFNNRNGTTSTALVNIILQRSGYPRFDLFELDNTHPIRRHFMGRYYTSHRGDGSYASVRDMLFSFLQTRYPDFFPQRFDNQAIDREPASATKAVVLDLSGVCFHFNYEKLGKIFLKHRGDDSFISTNDIRDYFQYSDNVVIFEHGGMSYEAFFSHTCDSLDLMEITQAEFYSIYNSLFEEQRLLHELVKHLKDKGYRVYLLTDASPPHIEYIAHNFSDFLSDFEGVFCTRDYKTRKRNPDLFTHKLPHEMLRSLYDIREILIIDSKRSVIEQAHAAGYQCLLYRGFDMLVQEFLNAGMLTTDKHPIPREESEAPISH